MSRPHVPPRRALLAAAVLLALGLILVATTALAQASPFLDPHLVADVAPGFPGSGIERVCPVVEGPDRMLFITGLSEIVPFSRTLWRTDGTPGGTFLLQESDASAVFFLRCTGDGAFFEGSPKSSGNRALWWTDGTPEATRPLLDLSGPAVSEALPGGRFLATGQEWGPGTLAETRGLWVTDRTEAGTHPLPLADARFDQPLSALRMATLDDRVVIQVIAEETDDAPLDDVLWVSDGTPAGTRFVHALGPEPDRITALQRVGDRVLVLTRSVAQNPLTLGLWVSDGTAAGTARVPVDLPGDQLVSFQQVISTAAGERLVFVVGTGTNEASHQQLWVSDGTAEGTVLLLENPRIRSGAVTLPWPGPLVGHDGRFYFTHDDEVRGGELWSTDLTPEGTNLVMDLCPGPCSSDARLLRDYGDRVLLEARPPGEGNELWVSDLTVAGTRLLADLCPGACSSFPHDLLEPEGAGGWLLFAARPGPSADTREQLWELPPPDPERSPLVWPPAPRAATSFPGTGFHARRPMGPFVALDHQVLFVHGTDVYGSEVWTLPVDGFLPEAPAGPFLGSPLVPGFRFKVRITPGAGTTPIVGRPEGECIPETLCVSGALAGRSEVFLRVVGPKPNGFLWPTLVKFSTSAVEVWVEQTATGTTRWYLLPGAAPGVDELPGLFDRLGFTP